MLFLRQGLLQVEQERSIRRKWSLVLGRSQRLEKKGGLHFLLGLCHRPDGTAEESSSWLRAPPVPHITRLSPGVYANVLWKVPRRHWERSWELLLISYPT